ncbi:MAG TPA: neprosin family prolyl endopeptidase [Polyangiaceae bacterium]|nr:neprosin family prolyl endopeptidase [Polyangiaceae bacterium]
MALTGCEGEFDPNRARDGVDDAELPPAIAVQVAGVSDRAARAQVVGAWRARRAEVAAFLERRSRGWDVVATRRSSSGQIFDYVRAETLYPGAPDAPFATPPPLPAGAEAEVAGVARARSEFDTDPSLRPPAGTIAVARPSFEPYELGAIGARDLAEYLELAWPKPAPAYVNNRLYGTHRDVRANIGTSGNINLWDYQQVASGEMSLLQTAALCWGTSPSTTLEAIEVGFQKLPSKYDDTTVHLFTFFRTAGGASGDRVGGYNLDVQGFIQAAGAFPPGAAVSPFSTPDGTQYECRIEVQLFQGNWWVYACGVWIGYYPTQNSTVAAGSRINFDLIGSGTCEIHWYGEIYDAAPTTWTQADMGSGRFAADGHGRAAYIREPWLIHADGSTSWFSSSVPGTGNGYDPDCYTVSSVFQNGGPSWGRWFYVGGPGGDNPGCN